MRERGYYGDFGGAYIPEILVATFDELVEAFATAEADPAFWAEYQALMSSYSCRPTPLSYAENLTEHFGGARILVGKVERHSEQRLCAQGAISHFLQRQAALDGQPRVVSNHKPHSRPKRIEPQDPVVCRVEGAIEERARLRDFVVGLRKEIGRAHV